MKLAGSMQQAIPDPQSCEAGMQAGNDEYDRVGAGHPVVIA